MYLIEQCVEYKMSRSIAAIKQLNSNVILFITFKKNEGLSSGYLVSNFDNVKHNVFSKKNLITIFSG